VGAALERGEITERLRCMQASSAPATEPTKASTEDRSAQRTIVPQKCVADDHLPKGQQVETRVEGGIRLIDSVAYRVDIS